MVNANFSHSKIHTTDLQTQISSVMNWSDTEKMNCLINEQMVTGKRTTTDELR